MKEGLGYTIGARYHECNLKSGEGERFKGEETSNQVTLTALTLSSSTDFAIKSLLYHSSKKAVTILGMAILRIVLLLSR